MFSSKICPPIFLFPGGTLLAGFLSALLTSGSADQYQTLVLPPLSPPGILFPIVWTILYILMGIAAAIIFCSDSPDRYSAFRQYLLQLAVNLIWPILFFSLEHYTLAFFWLLLLLVLTLYMTRSFYQIRPQTLWLLIPYILWLCFAAYLNLGILLLN